MSTESILSSLNKVSTELAKLTNAHSRLTKDIKDYKNEHSEIDKEITSMRTTAAGSGVFDNRIDDLSAKAEDSQLKIANLRGALSINSDRQAVLRSEYETLLGKLKVHRRADADKDLESLFNTAAKEAACAIGRLGALVDLYMHIPFYRLDPSKVTQEILGQRTSLNFEDYETSGHKYMDELVKKFQLNEHAA